MAETARLEEELFCTRLELETFANYTYYGKLERWIPGFIDRSTEDSHQKRYELACRYSAGKSVLDLACGSGCGSHLLATSGNADRVLGVDIDEDALRYARHRYGHERIQYAIGDANTYAAEDQFGLIVSFETIEHISQPENFLANMNRSLKEGGQMLLSTPISAVDIDRQPKNIYHRQEWGFKTFQAMVEKFLGIEEVFLQLYPAINDSLWARLVRKMSPGKKEGEPFLSAIETLDKTPGSVLAQLGKRRRGYQVLLCKKR